ncbi:hypothetical protein IAU60_002986 [Kwoniella sp. DSM 27419]
MTTDSPSGRTSLAPPPVDPPQLHATPTSTAPGLSRLAHMTSGPSDMPEKPRLTTARTAGSSKGYSSSILPTIGNPEGSALRRTTTGGSLHARNALRRMATHETGEGVDHEDQDLVRDGEEEGGLDTHHEDHERSSESSDERKRRESRADDEGDEEAQLEGDQAGEKPRNRFGKKEVELQDQTNLLPVRQVITVFAGLTCALFCSLLDQTIVTTALPTLGKVFNRADISSWVGTAYLLTSTTAQPIYGRVSDIFGRKFTLLACLFIFLMGSLACALAQTMIQLIIFRAIQGFGGGGILTLSMIIVSDVVTLKERGKYQGIIGVVVALANSMGPILGGVFTEKASWRWCFYVNLPLTVISMFTVALLLPLRRPKGSMVEKLKKLDFYGSLLTLAWATLILIALSWGGSQYAWDSAAVIAPLIIGFAVLGVFLFVEWKVVSLPLVPMRLFKNRSVSACYMTTLFNGMAFYATMYYLPQYFQVVKRVSAIRSGVLTLPLMLVQTTTAFLSGIIQSRTGDYWWNLVVGFSIWTIGLGCLSSITATTEEWKLAVFQVITAVGAGQTFQTSLVAIQGGVERKDMATATGLRNFVRMLGGTISLAVGNAIINNRVRSHLQGTFDSQQLERILADPLQSSGMGLTASQMNDVINAYSQGIRGVFYFTTPVIGISVFITLAFVKREKIKRGADEAAKKAEAKAWVESKRAKRRGHADEHDAEADSRPASIEGGSEQDHEQEEKARDRPERVDSEATVTEKPSGGDKIKEEVKDSAKFEAEAFAGAGEEGRQR